jgi:glycosyltransferase involved in cell wall biosynthesis
MLHFRTVPNPEWFEKNAPATMLKFNLPDRFFMLPNQFWAHKNHKVVFEAVKILSDRGIKVNVVCTGSTSDYRNRDYFRTLLDYIDQTRIAPGMFILGFIPRLEQIQIMRRSLAVIQPSLFEGWSTVVEDARCLGKRVLLSDIPVHREQQLPEAVFFDPTDPEQLADVMRSQWAGLEGSAFAGSEKTSRETQSGLVTDYARQFLSLARELVAT